MNFNEFVSAMIIFYEVQNGTRSDIEFKPNDKERPHYRKFMVDMKEPLSESPSKLKTNWRDIQKEYFKKNGKFIKTVKRRKDSALPPKGSICQHCYAPARYLYINNGRYESQFICKVCGGSSPTNKKRITPKSQLWCPYCGKALYQWKSSKTFTSFKCGNRKCSHYINNKKLLTSDETEELNSKPGISSQYKLHYQFRIFHFNPSEIAVKRPTDDKGIDLGRIHNDMRTFSLVLTFYICFGLSSRMTRDVLRHTFNINSVSHQSVLNYIKAAAYHLYHFTDQNCPKPKGIMPADETYISVNGKWHYTWFGIDAKTRAICGYNVTEDRETTSALAFLYNALGAPEENIGKRYETVMDGNPSYDSAILAYQQKAKEISGTNRNIIDKHTVIGLKNLDDESAEYRPFKQMIERLNRTYKFHTRPRAGFKNLEGATALTVMFVAFYNFMRPHTSLHRLTPVKLECLKGVTLYPDMWIRLIRTA